MAYLITPFSKAPGDEFELWLELKSYFVDSLDQVTDPTFTAWGDGEFHRYHDGRAVAQQDWPPDHE